jgi:hypothetical protein
MLPFMGMLPVPICEIMAEPSDVPELIGNSPVAISLFNDLDLTRPVAECEL